MAWALSSDRSRLPKEITKNRKESQDGTETDRSSRVITVLPNKTEDMYKRKVGLLGLEPRTNGLKVRCSNQLSYSPGKNPEHIPVTHFVLRYCLRHIQTAAGSHKRS